MDNAKKSQTKVPALRRGRFQLFEPSAEHSGPPDITAPSSPKSFKCFRRLMVDWCRPLARLGKGSTVDGGFSTDDHSGTVPTENSVIRAILGGQLTNLEFQFKAHNHHRDNNLIVTT